MSLNSRRLRWKFKQSHRNCIIHFRKTSLPTQILSHLSFVRGSTYVGIRGRFFIWLFFVVVVVVLDSNEYFFSFNYFNYNPNVSTLYTSYGRSRLSILVCLVQFQKKVCFTFISPKADKCFNVKEFANFIKILKASEIVNIQARQNV